MASVQTPSLKVVPIGATLDRQLNELEQLRNLAKLIDQADQAIATYTRQRGQLQLRFDELLNRKHSR